MNCDCCGRWTNNDDLNRINPAPYDELIVCGSCYDWCAWEIPGNLAPSRLP